MRNHRKKWTDAEMRAAFRLHENGWTLRQVAGILGRTYSAIERVFAGVEGEQSTQADVRRIADDCQEVTGVSMERIAGKPRAGTINAYRVLAHRLRFTLRPVPLVDVAALLGRKCHDNVIHSVDWQETKYINLFRREHGLDPITVREYCAARGGHTGPNCKRNYERLDDVPIYDPQPDAR